MSSITNNVPYLSTTRSYPEEPTKLRNELTRSWTELSNTINQRTIGIFDGAQIITGEQWGTAADGETKKQSVRQIYYFGAVAAGGSEVIPHGFATISMITKLFGSVVTAAPDFRPLPYVALTASNQISLLCDNTNITVSVGSGSPNVTSGVVVLEALQN